jgi:hypothetical protein
VVGVHAPGTRRKVEHDEMMGIRIIRMGDTDYTGGDTDYKDGDTDYTDAYYPDVVSGRSAPPTDRCRMKPPPPAAHGADVCVEGAP